MRGPIRAIDPEELEVHFVARKHVEDGTGGRIECHETVGGEEQPGTLCMVLFSRKGNSHMAGAAPCSWVPSTVHAVPWGWVLWPVLQ